MMTMTKKRWWQKLKNTGRDVHRHTPKLTENILFLYPTLQMAPPNSQDLLDNDMSHTARDSANYKVKLISSPFSGKEEWGKNMKKRSETLLRALVD